MKVLCDLHEGESAVIRQLHLQGSILRRLQDLGLLCGTCVTCCKIAHGGTPIAYQFRGSMIALRRSDTRRIEIEPCPNA